MNYYEDEELESELHASMSMAQHADAAAGAWAAGAVEAMAKASHACLEYRSHKRASAAGAGGRRC